MMPFRRLLNVILLLLIVSSTQLVCIDVHAQKKGRPPKSAKKNKPPKNPEEAMKMEGQKERKIDRDIEKLKKDYKKSLDKDVAKRMKRNRKRSIRHAKNKKDPFYKRWFSHRSKRVRKSKR